MNIRESNKSTQLYFSLIKDTLPHSLQSANLTLDHRSDNSCCALWLQSGQVTINDTPLESGSGFYITPNDTISTIGSDTTVMLRFILSTELLTTNNVTDNEQLLCETIYSQRIDVTFTNMLLRLDQVDFPPGAVAYKHTHPGPGIRYLVDGGLTLSSDHGELKIHKGDAWFEDANSPVIATAIAAAPSHFVRAMLLPLEFEARSTFTLHDQTDASKPRLQSNIRHFEKRIDLLKIR